MPRRNVFVATALALTCLSASISPLQAQPDQCSRRGVASVIRSFVSAYNKGDLRKLDSLFARGDAFGWYKVTPLEREWPDSDNRSTLVSYFEARHGKGDELKLLDLRVNKTPDDQGRRGFSFIIRRESSDFMPLASGTFDGKGGADCSKIYSWFISGY